MSETTTLKAILFEQGKYKMVQSDLKDGEFRSYDVVNVETGNIERQESGYGYAKLWVKHLDFMYEKSDKVDPDRDEEARRNEFLNKPKASIQEVSLPGSDTPKGA